ncbi:MAG: UPF0182 family protein, partial [Oscillospiraceae bacterium]|nr:UPF0182 family protein [Oscillospiraceae bacterium]
MNVIDVEKLRKNNALKKHIKWLTVAIVIIAVLSVAFILLKGVYMEVIQLDEIGGLSSVFWTNIGYQVVSYIACFILIFAAVFVTSHFCGKTAKKHRAQMNQEPAKFYRLVPALACALIGTGIFNGGFYIKIMSFLNSVPFEVNDPLFNKDIGYYIFQRPFLVSSYELLLNLSLFIIVYTLGYYFITLINQDLEAFWDVIKNESVVRHCIINVSIFIAIKIFHFQFLKEDLLYSNVVEVTGAGYVDVNVWMRYMSVAPFILVAILLCSIFFLMKKKLSGVLITIAAYPVIWALTLLISVIVQFLVVNPNEYSLEKQFIEYNIRNTRQAFGLDKIRDFEFPVMEELDRETVMRNTNIIDNVRVVDIESTIQNNLQLQSNTNFYTFVEGDILVYNINGRDTPVFTSPREMDPNKLPEKSYVNTRYKYTHGYGVVMNSINKISPVGQVEYIMSGLRMRSVDDALEVVEPRLYYGEVVGNEQVIVNANEINEIDYDGNLETRYSGTGGIKLNLLNRLMFAIENADINLLTSRYAGGATLLLNRNVIARAQKAFPFIWVDRDPYIVLTDEGRLIWVLDAYTYSDKYPYSQRISGINYIRNSLKIVIDAYNGTTEYYIIDKDCPILQVYSKIYPGVFKDEPLPVSAQEHIRYPEVLFDIKTQLLLRYHLNESESSMFYSKQDLWEIAKHQASLRSDVTEDLDSFYNLLRLPGELGDKEELILMLPFTPSGENKNNMVSWLAVRNDQEHYGEAILFTFPKNMNVFGPYQVEIKINQIDSISTNMTLWGQGGSEVYKGNLLVIPIENSVLYVEPIYIKATGQFSIPEVRQIVVGYQSGDDFINGIGSNLDGALLDLFGISDWSVIDGSGGATAAGAGGSDATAVGASGGGVAADGIDAASGADGAG